MRKAIGYMIIILTIIGLLVFGYYYNINQQNKRTPDQGFESNQLKFGAFTMQLNAEIDEYRDSQQLNCLEYDFELSLIAFRRLKDLQGKPLSHNGWKEQLISNKAYGEVLARGFELNHQAILFGWQNSKKHDDVITGAKFKKIGIATDGDTVVAILSN